VLFSGAFATSAYILQSGDVENGAGIFTCEWRVAGFSNRWVLTRRRVGGELPGAALATQGAGREGSARGGDCGSADAGRICAQCSSRGGWRSIRDGVFLVSQGGCREGCTAASMDGFQLIMHV